MVKDTYILHILHGGKFVVGPPTKYVGGKSDFIENVDPDLMSKFEMDDLIEKIGYEPTTCKYYHCLPDCDLDGGIRLLSNDNDVLDMFACHNGRNTIAMFVEHMRELMGDNENQLGLDEGEIPEGLVENVSDGSENSKDSDYEYLADGDSLVENDNVIGDKEISFLEDIPEIHRHFSELIPNKGKAKEVEEKKVMVMTL